MKKKNDNVGELSIWMRLLLLTLIGAMAGAIGVMLTVSCSPKIVEKVVTQVEYRDRIVHDTTTFEVTKEVEKVVTRDTVSHIENRWAKTDAVLRNGSMFHTLESKPQLVKIPVEIHVTDTVWKEQSVITEIKEVEKPLTWWQTFRMNAFPYLVLVVVLALAWIFRKFIFKL